MSRFDDSLIIKLKKEGKTWQEIGDVFGVKGESVRAYSRNKIWYKEIRNPKHMNTHLIDEENLKLETFHSKTTLSDGSISSSIRERLLEKKQFTEKELLELHGFSSEEFKIKTVTSNEWSMTNSEGEKYYNFQSKIIAELTTLDTLPIETIKEVFKDTEPWAVFIDEDLEADGYITINLFDMHFGLNSLEDYKDLLRDIIRVIRNTYKEILIIVGGDYYQTENFNNTTVKGTQLDTVDYPKMIKDGSTFLFTLCKEAYQYSKKTKLIYLPGNHASAADFDLVYYSSLIFPRIETDIELTEYKHVWLGNHSIFAHHGDKRISSSKLLEVVVGSYAKEWGEAKSRYLFTGHLHHEKSLDIAGMTHYQCMSPSKPSEYDKAKGYVTSERGVQIFEFDEVKRRAIYYL